MFISLQSWFFFLGQCVGKGYKSQQLCELVSYASSWLLTETGTCPCPCFGLGSRLCAEFMASAHFRLVPVTLQPLHLPVAAIFSPFPVYGHFLSKKHLKMNSKFVEISLNGQHILCGAFLSPHFFFSFFIYQTSRQDQYLLACQLIQLQQVLLYLIVFVFFRHHCLTRFPLLIITGGISV